MRDDGMRNAWRWVAVAAVTFSVVGVWGCRSRSSETIDPRRLARYERSMLRHAARDTGCPAGQLIPQVIQQQPRVYTVLGCHEPVEYWLECSARGRCRLRDVPRLTEQAASLLGCQPAMIQQQPTQMPNVRYAIGCGASLAFAIQCNSAACGWAQTIAPQGAGGVVVVNPAPQEPQRVVVAREEPAAPPEDALQSQVQTHREAIMSCVDAASLTLRLRWTADGQVVVQLPAELIGTAAEGCIQAAVGALQVSAHQAGEIVVPLE